jgi:hypothetical protein
VVKFRIQELGPSVIRCMREADRRAMGITTLPAVGSLGGGTCEGVDGKARPLVGHPGRSSKGPNKTEAEYRRRFIDPHRANLCSVAFEGLTFRLANGHRYTPDWVYVEGGRLVCIEVKGSYRLGSYQRARLAFDQAAVEWPGLRWIWAERRVDGSWCVNVKEVDHGMS